MTLRQRILQGGVLLDGDPMGRRHSLPPPSGFSASPRPEGRYGLGEDQLDRMPSLEEEPRARARANGV
jgi:hypothetical protein